MKIIKNDDLLNLLGVYLLELFIEADTVKLIDKAIREHANEHNNKRNYLE